MREECTRWPSCTRLHDGQRTGRSGAAGGGGSPLWWKAFPMHWVPRSRTGVRSVEVQDRQARTVVTGEVVCAVEVGMTVEVRSSRGCGSALVGLAVGRVMRPPGSG